MIARCLACALALVAPMTLGVACKGGGDSVEGFITILQTAPPDEADAVNVEVRLGFQVSDGAAIDASTLNEETFFLTDEDGNVVTGTYSIGGDDGSPDVAVMDLEEPLDVITTYTATVTTGLVAGGASLEENFEWNFRTIDSAWGESEWLEATNTGVSDRPDGAVDAQLNAFAVWEYEEAGGTSVWANRYTRQDLWGEPTPIDGQLPGASRPKVAADDNGNAFAVWQRIDTGGSPTDRIWTNRYDAEAGGWESAELLQDLDQPARTPAIAADSDGNAIAIWVERDEDTQDQILTASRYEPGSGWGPSERIDQEPTPLAGNRTALEMDDEGNAIALWSRATVNGDVLWANRYVAGSGWGTAAMVKSDPETDARAERLSVSANGEAFVIWIQNEGERDDIWAARYAGGTWEAPERIDDYDADNKTEPDVAVDGSGVAHAVWVQTDPDFANIWAARYTPDAGWSAPELIEPPNEDPDEDGDAAIPRVDTNTTGNFFVVWRQVWQDWQSVWSNRLDPGGDWMGAERIEFIPRSAKVPFILVDEDRHAHAIWLHSLDTGIDWVRTNRFE